MSERAGAQLAAFTGAEGFGASATGGRGGSVYVVTNLNDSGAGSFRDAVSHSNRIVVFAVSGYADITSPISAASNLTILGQTAPGGGFGVYGAEVSFYGKSNDIVQYVRFRDTSQDPAGQSTNNSSGNCINLGNTSNMIFDHVSLEFASYNNVDAAGTTGANSLTFQNSIVANPIQDQQFNFHWEGDQGTFINNIFANAHNRSILAKGNAQFVNNSVYNYQGGFTSGDSSGHFNYDVVNNYFVSGPSTTSTGNNFYQVNANQQAYAAGNLLDSNNSSSSSNDRTLNGSADNNTGATVSSTPLLAGTISLPTLTATAAYAFNLMHSGASLTHDPATYASSLGYDQVDQQVISNVASNGADGQLYNTELSTGLSNNGLGTIASGTAPASTANDGIPDSWKRTHGLSTTAANSTLLNPVGYMMIEQYAYQISDLYNSQTWSSASGNWVSSSANWSSATPGAYDHALIVGNGASNGSVTISGSNAARAFSVSIGGNGPAAGESLLVSGGSLLVYNSITVGDQNNGKLQITGGTVQAATVQLGNTVWNSSGNSSSTYTGTLVLSGGTLQAGEVMQGGGTPGNWNTGSAWTWSGGTLQAGPAGLLVGAPATLGAASGILDTNGASVQMNGLLSGNGGLVVTGGGTATLAAANTYTGPTAISSGVVSVPSLSNGGVAGGLGASSNAAGNLLLAGGTLIGAGSTDRLFTLTSDSTLDASNGMSFTNTGAIAFNAGSSVTLTLTGSDTGHNTFSPALADPGGGLTTSVIKSGSGKWDFSGGAKTYSGDTNVTGGTLETLSANALSAQSTIVIASGAVVDLHANSQTIDALSGAGALKDSFGTSQTLTIGQANGSGSFTGTVNGPLALVKNGAGVQSLSGSNTYTNGTSINGGTLSTGAAGSLANGGLASSIGQSGNAAANLILNGGTLQIAGTGAATSTDRLFTLTASGGTLDASGTNPVTFAGNGVGSANAIAFSGAGTRTLTLTGNNTGANTLAPIIADSDASHATSLTKTGTGVWSISGSNSYTGPTTITGGTLSIPALANGGVASNLGASSNAAPNLILNGGTLLGAGSTDRLFTLAADSALDSSNGMSFTSTGAVAFGNVTNVTLTVTGWNTGHNTFSLALADPGVGLTTSVVKGGIGKWDFSGGTKTYSGDTNVTGGTLETLSTNALSSQSNVVISAGAVVDLHAFSQTIDALSGAGTLYDSFGTSQTLTIGQADGSGTFTGTVNGPLSLVKNGVGVQSLSGSNTFSGVTSINRGTLKLDFSPVGAATSNIINSSSSLVLSGGTLQFTGNTTTASSQTFAGTTLNAGASAISVTSAGAGLSATLGAISRNAGSTVQFVLPATGAFGTSTGMASTLLSAGSTAYATVGTSDWAAKSSSNGNIAAGSSISGFYTNNPTGSAVTLSGNVDMVNAGQVTFTSAQSPSSIRFNNAAGALTLTASGTLLGTGGVLVTPNVGANNVTITDNNASPASFASLRPVSSAAGQELVFHQYNTAGQLIVNTAIANNGGNAATITQTGTGTVVFNGASVYTGQTFLNGGTTLITSEANLGAPASAASLNLNGGTLAGNAVFALDNGSPYASPRPVNLTNNGGTLAATGGNAMTVDGAISGSGPLAIGAGTIAGTGSGTANTTALTGIGTVVLSGASKYTGPTALNAGTVNVGSAENAGTSGPLGNQTASAAGTIIFAGGTLQYSTANHFDYSGRFSTAANQAISIDTNGQAVSFAAPLASPGGRLTKFGAGTLTLTSAGSYTGPTTVNGGTLLLDFSAAGAPASNIVSASSALTLGGGSLQIAGDPTGISSQTFAGVTLAPGASAISIPNPGAGQIVGLGAISRNTGATVQFTLPSTGNISTSTGTTSSLLTPGPSAIVAYATVGASDWAATDFGNANIVAAGSIGGFYTNNPTGSSVALTGNVDVVAAGQVRFTSNQFPASIRFNNSAGATTITAKSGSLLGTGGILVTPGVGAANVTITDDNAVPTTVSGLRPNSNASGEELVLHQYNTSGELIVNTGITNNGSNAATLTRTGPGTVVLNGASFYTGQTFLNGGATLIASNASLGATAVAATVNLNGGTLVGNANLALDNGSPAASPRPVYLGNNAGALAATAGTTMTVDGVVSGSAPLTIGLGTIAGTGAGTANTTAVNGSGAVVLSGANIYLGGTTISAGTLLANSTDTTNGSTGPGLVNVASGGTLGGNGQIRGSVAVKGTITAGSAVAGAAPGLLTANAFGQTTTFAGGGTYAVKISSSAANGIAGTNWDELALSGMAVSATSANPFRVTLNSLNSWNTAGAISGLSSSLWVIGTMTAAPTGVTLSGNGTTILAVAGTGPGVPAVTSGDVGLFVLDTSAFAAANSINPSSSYLALELINTSGTNYTLDVYTSAPEPGTGLLTLVGAAPMLTRRRRRRHAGI